MKPEKDEVELGLMPLGWIGIAFTVAILVGMGLPQLWRWIMSFFPWLGH